MSRLATSSIVRKIESLFDGGSIAGWSDRELLERFYRQRDATGETAFAVLVARHGPVVLHVCRQLLGNSHDAEDAFQAVFFVLARKADCIRDPDLLGNWLYGVAIRTARKAKAKIGRRRGNDDIAGTEDFRSSSSPAIKPMTEPADQPLIVREEAEELHNEINRLPSRPTKPRPELRTALSSVGNSQRRLARRSILAIS
jgi:RNA polymerase sigma factor (sigma-70 family)